MSKKAKKVHKVGNLRIVPISIKILWVFVCLLLFSNFSTNLVSLMLSQRQINQLTNTILSDHLKQVFMSASNQYELYKYSDDKDTAVNAMKTVAETGLTGPGNIAAAFNTEGELLFIVNGKKSAVEERVGKVKVSQIQNLLKKTRSGADSARQWQQFPDSQALKELNRKLMIGTGEGIVQFNSDAGEYRGVYKYQKDWNLYLLCAEQNQETMGTTIMNFTFVAVLIVFVTIVFICAGLYLLNRILKNIESYADQLYEMHSQNRLGTIDISKAPNDDVTYFAASFNSLSSSVNNMLTTFQKFVPKDVAAKAYAGAPVSLEGKQRELTVMFSDIRNFTNKTEVLGNEIIDLLNIHYGRVIHLVHENNGVIGSIIGDAILGIYGTESAKNKSLDAVNSAWQMIRVTSEFRENLKKRKTEIEHRRKLNDSEEKIYRACLVEIGVGLDGGTVFYGNIGSIEHMANTVIGDNVNSASRLEGLTRVYAVPVIATKYIKEEVEKVSSRYHFAEIDMVQVKGMTEGRKIYFPLDTENEPEEIIKEFDEFEEALNKYYKGDWSGARKKFKSFKKFMQSKKPAYVTVADVFIHRMGLKQAKAGWNGIWTMTTK